MTILFTLLLSLLFFLFCFFQIKVQYIDFGNTEELNPSKLVELPKSLVALPWCAIKIVLHSLWCNNSQDPVVRIYIKYSYQYHLNFITSLLLQILCQQYFIQVLGRTVLKVIMTFLPYGVGRTLNLSWLQNYGVLRSNPDC